MRTTSPLLRSARRAFTTISATAVLLPLLGVSGASAAEASTLSCAGVPLQVAANCATVVENITAIAAQHSADEAQQLLGTTGTFIEACTPVDRVDLCESSMASLATSTSSVSADIPTVDQVVYVVQSLPVQSVLTDSLSDGYSPISSSSDPLDIATLRNSAGSSCPWGVWTSTARRTYKSGWGVTIFWHNMDVKYEVKGCKVTIQYFATNTGDGQHGWSFDTANSKKTIVGAGTPHVVVDGVGHFVFNYYWSHNSYDSHCWRDEYGNGTKPGFNCSN